MNSLRRILAIIIKELLQLGRDRMTFGMVAMIPLVQLILFGYAINTNIRHIPVAVVDHSNSSLSRSLIQAVGATQVVKFTHRYTTENEAVSAIINSTVRAVLIIPANMSQRLVRHPNAGLASALRDNPHSMNRPVVQWIVDGSDTMISSAIKGLRQMPLNELFHQPTMPNAPTFEITLYFNPEQRTVVNIVPGLIGVILTMTMIMFTSAAIVRERERGNMEMLINMPIRPFELMLGKTVPYVFIGFIQMAIILGLGYLIFDVPIAGGFVQLIYITGLFILASLSFGLVISTLTHNQLQATQMTVFILLPSILLSGFIFPYEGMPLIAQYIAELLPATHFTRAIRGVVLRGASFQELQSDALWLLIFTIVGLTAASLRFKKRLG